VAQDTHGVASDGNKRSPARECAPQNASGQAAPQIPVNMPATVKKACSHYLPATGFRRRFSPICKNLQKFQQKLLTKNF
jgi:hypothetical protein